MKTVEIINFFFFVSLSLSSERLILNTLSGTQWICVGSKLWKNTFSFTFKVWKNLADFSFRPFHCQQWLENVGVYLAGSFSWFSIIDAAVSSRLFNIVVCAPCITKNLASSVF